jgi:thiosulfate dehydrogenase
MTASKSAKATMVLALLFVTVVSCVPSTAREAGAQMFADPRFSGSEANAFSCATCHAIGAGAGTDGFDGDGRIRAGFPLDDAAARTRFWGGASTSLLDATNTCVTNFMRGPALVGDEPKARALYEFVASHSTESGAAIGSVHEARPLTIVENVTSVGRGSSSRGAKVWDAACRTCHGDPHTGNGRITELATIVPEGSAEFAEQVGFPLDLVVVEKVRHGRFFGVGGTMPPFAVEQLSDDDLGAVLAFLGL